jgi:hypothetical protein
MNVIVTEKPGKKNLDLLERSKHKWRNYVKVDSEEM